jgi:methylmalonyl-CoA mutase cobalamin-binding domain/chain
MDPQQALIERLQMADRAGAGALLESWAAKNGYDRLVTEILDPVLARIGEEWMSSGAITLSQAYVAGKVAEDVMSKIPDKPGADAQSAKRPVIIGNIEEDFHALGRKMMGTFLRAAGWEVHDLGNDTPAAAFVDIAVETGARVIGVSAMMSTTARNIKAVRQEICKRGLEGRIKLAAGGAIFRVCPNMVEKVGADGTAPTALAAASLFERLWVEAVNLEAAS